MRVSVRVRVKVRVRVRKLAESHYVTLIRSPHRSPNPNSGPTHEGTDVLTKLSIEFRAALVDNKGHKQILFDEFGDIMVQKWIG